MLSLSDIVNVKVGIGRGVFEAPGATVIGGKKPSFNLEILKLFANGEQGFWYDPNDMGTMFQDAVGTVPVTAVGQAVGLMLDKSKGLVLGSEFLTNNWNLSGQVDWSYSNGVLTKSGITAGGGPLQLNTSPFFAGRLYRVEYEIISVGNGGLVAIQFQGGTSKAIQYRGVVGKYVEYLFAAEGNTYLRVIANGASAVFSMKVISVKELTGNHAYQTTSASRPLLKDAPRKIDFDTVDDKLITNLPTQLTGCTAIRSVPNVGTQILTGQTIPATYEDNTDHCGLLVINRALTPIETSAITSEFNKRAGV